MFDNAELALSFFSQQRSTQKDKDGNFNGGVTIPSQIRSVRYVSSIINHGYVADRRSFELKKIFIYGNAHCLPEGTIIDIV